MWASVRPNMEGCAMSSRSRVLSLRRIGARGEGIDFVAGRTRPSTADPQYLQQSHSTQSILAGVLLSVITSNTEKFNIHKVWNPVRLF